jgi:hypothetical protein
VGLNAIDQMFFIPAYPLWSLIGVGPLHLGHPSGGCPLVGAEH